MKTSAHCLNIPLSVALGLTCFLAAAPCLGIEKAGQASPEDEAQAEPLMEPGPAAGTDDNSSWTDENRRQLPREIVQFGGEVVIGPDEETRDLVVLFGTVRVEGRVRGDVVVVCGSATVDGVVDGDVVMPFGSLELGPDADVAGDVVVVLGEMDADAAAYIGGERVEITLSALEEHLPPMTGLRRWVMEGLVLGRPLPHQAGWWWWFALACAFLYLITALIFARPIAISVDALESRPVGSFFLGLLVFLLSGPLLLLLIATGIGLLVVPFVLCAAFVAFLFGKVAVYQYLGRQIGRQLKSSMLQVPLLALIIGVGAFYFMYMVPVLGLLVWLLVGLLGVGAVLLAFFDAFRTEGMVAPAGSAAPPVIPASVGESPAPSAPPLIPGQSPVPPLVEPGSLTRVGFWLRLTATLIDLLLVGALVSLIRADSWFLPAWVVYHVGLWAWRGTTIGGVVLRIKVVRQDGRSVDFPIALIRSLSSFLSAIPLFIGFLWAGWTRERVAWHDSIAGTIVVRMPRGVPLL